MKRLVFAFCFVTIAALTSCGNSESYGTRDSTSVVENQLSTDTFMHQNDSPWENEPGDSAQRRE